MTVLVGRTAVFMLLGSLIAAALLTGRTAADADPYRQCAQMIWDRWGEDNTWRVIPSGGNPATFNDLLTRRLHCPQLASWVLEPPKR